MSNKKIKITPKVRTRTEIDQEYQFHALQVGHKDRLLNQLSDDIEMHRKKLIELNVEGNALPPEAPAPLPEAPAPALEAATEGSAP